MLAKTLLSEIVYNLIMDLKVNYIEKVSVNGERLLDVGFEIIDGETKTNRRLSFSIETSLDEIKKELATYLDNCENEKKQAVVQKKIDKQDENADNVIEGLNKYEIKKKS